MSEEINTDVSRTDEPVDPFGIEVAFVSNPVEGTYVMSFGTSKADSIFRIAAIDSFGYDSATFIDYYILDENWLNSTFQSYLIFEGQVDSSGTNLHYTVGIPLVKNYTLDVYNVLGGTGWTCAGENCTSCKPQRDPQWYIVTGCNCLGAGDHTKPSYCNHSSSGMAEAILSLIGIIISL